MQIQEVTALFLTLNMPLFLILRDPRKGPSIKLVRKIFRQIIIFPTDTHTYLKVLGDKK